MEKDPGHRLGNIAATRQSWRQRKLRGGGMRRQYGSAAGTRCSPKNVLGSGHMGSVAKSGRRPEPTPHAYRGERWTGQAPCFAMRRTVSPVRRHSPVRYIAAPRIGLG
jgi:hypothetical protein